MPENANQPANRISASEVLKLADLVAYKSDAIVSRTLISKSGGTITMFAFAAGQGLSEHTAPFDALVCVLEGDCKLTLGGKVLKLSAGEIVLMPANVPHALESLSHLKMMLVMLRQ